MADMFSSVRFGVRRGRFSGCGVGFDGCGFAISLGLDCFAFVGGPNELALTLKIFLRPPLVICLDVAESFLLRLIRRQAALLTPGIHLRVVVPHRPLLLRQAQLPVRGHVRFFFFLVAQRYRSMPQQHLGTLDLHLLVLIAQQDAQCRLRLVAEFLVASIARLTIKAIPFLLIALRPATAGIRFPAHLARHGFPRSANGPNLSRLTH